MATQADAGPRVFLSSRLRPDVRPIREDLKIFCERGGIELDFGDESRGARSATPLEDSLNRVRNCDLFVLVVGESGIGPYTAAEWRESQSRGLPELVFFSSRLSEEDIRQLIADVFEGATYKESTHDRYDADSSSPSALIYVDVSRRAKELGSVDRSAHRRFVEEVRDYCDASGWLPDDVQLVTPGQAWFLATSPQGRDLIFCCDDKIDPDDIAAADRLAAQQSADHFRVISELTFSKSLRAMQTQTPSVLQTINAFLFDILDVEDDIKKIESEAADMDLARRFVELGCEERHLDPSRREFATVRHESALRYAKAWLHAPSRKQLAVLGDFGTGKSWLGRRLSLYLCERLRAREPGRIPLFVRLADALGEADGSDDAPTLRQYIRDRLSDEPRPDRLLDTLLNAGRLLLVLDGFDELGSGLDEATKDAHLESISTLTDGDSQLKVLLTSRRAFFDSAAAEGETLGEARPQRRSLRFDIVTLVGLKPGQVRERLRMQFGGPLADRYYRRIEKAGNLRTLVSRPIVLDMVLDILRAEKETTALTLYDIYAHCTDRWLRQIASDDSSLDETLRDTVTCELAWRMYRDNVEELDRKRLRKLIGEVRMLDELLRDMDRMLSKKLSPSARNETFLVRDGDGSYAFAHRSFMEFFAARKLLGELEAGRPELFGVKHISDGVAAFLLAHGVETEQLKSWLAQADAASGKWLAGNVLTLLNGSKVSLRGMDLSGLVIHKANLRDTDLRGVSFRDATLDGVLLAGADLGNADCRGATLQGLNLGVKSSAKTVACSPDNALAASADKDNNVVLITMGDDAPPANAARHRDSVTCARFNRDGTLLASVGFDARLLLWDMRKGASILELDTETASPYATAVLDEYDVVVAGGADSKLYAWNITDGADQGSRKQHSKEIYGIAYSAAAQRLATASFDHTVCVWTLAHPDLGFRVLDTQTLEAHETLVNGVAFSPDGSVLVSCDNAGTLMVFEWDEDGFVFDTRIQAHDTQAWCVRVSPDGQRAATCATDGTIAVWSTLDWSEQMRLTGHESAVWHLDFDHTSTRLVSSSLDGTVREWDLESASEMRCHLMGQPDSAGFECEGMNITGAKGLSDVQRLILQRLGAVDSSAEQDDDGN